MRCKELEAILEQDGLSPLPFEAQEHLAACPECQDFFSDLSAIVVAAKRIPAEAMPPDRVWICLRAQLAAEGIIREQLASELSGGIRWWQSLSELFRPRVLASAGAALFLVLGSVYIAKHPGPKPPQNALTASQPQVNKEIAAAPGHTQPAPAATGKGHSVRSRSNHVSGPPQPAEPGLRPSPSESAYLGETAGVLSQTESSLPGSGVAANAMADAALRSNLRTLNEFIAECEARLKQNPQDQMTREYLNVAYQQKAELLTAMMDSGRSEQ